MKHNIFLKRGQTMASHISTAGGGLGGGVTSGGILQQLQYRYSRNPKNGGWNG